MNSIRVCLLIGLSILTLTNVSKADDNTCIMSGCGPKTNCVDRRSPGKVDATTLGHLKLLCPDIAKDENSLFCCSSTQVSDLITNFIQPQSLFARCPACYENFRKVFCNFVCSPDQENFVRPNGTIKNSAGRDEIVEMSVFININFAQGLFDSCKNVQAATSIAIELMCGNHPKDCNAQFWLDFMGDKEAFSPFQINFHLSTEPETHEGKLYKPFNPEFHKCSSPAGLDFISCSCLDCVDSCKAGNGSEAKSEFIESNKEQKSFALTIDTSTLTAIIFGIVGSVIILGAFALQNMKWVKITPRELTSTDGKNVEVNGHSKPIRKTKTITIDKVTRLERVGTKMERTLQRGFRFWGTFVAQNPWKVMIASLITSLAMCLGLIFFQVTTDPVGLWVSPTSQARQDMDYFDTHFRPFYRVEQVIITPIIGHNYDSKIVNPSGGNEWGPVFEPQFLKAVMKLVKDIEELKTDWENRTISLKDVCLQPLEPYVKECIVQSVTIYFDKYKGEIDFNGEYLERFKKCVDNTGVEDCFGKYGGPLTPTEAAFGSYEQDASGKNLYHTARALVMTFPVLNNKEKEKNKMALAWEKKYLEYLKGYNNDLLSIAFKAERSVEDELERVSESDLPTVAVSYLVMFIYIAVALGDVDSLSTLMINTKVSLGLVGVAIVLLSVVSSLGIFFYAGVPATLIIVEVIPFLVLAVGVDNIFILVQAFQRDERQEGESMAEHIGRVVGEVAPSMMLSSVSMSCCFFIGALTDMPAVKIFALYAGVALIINFFLQMTCFLALFTFDTRRQESKRWDLICCLKSSVKTDKKPSQSFLYKAFKNAYTPFLLKTPVRVVVMFSFLIWLCSSIAVIDKIEVGLDQELSMPEDSYMLKYFKYLNNYLTIGPPLYFIITEGFDYTNRTKQKRICGSGGCNGNSLVAMTQEMKQFGNETYIAMAANSWIDDYFDYMRTDTCCRKQPDSTALKRCQFTSLDDRLNECDICVDPPRLPTGTIFPLFIDFFLEDIPGQVCPKAGRAQYKDSIETKIVNNLTEIRASHFMTYHTVLKTSKDFYQALDWARKISIEMTKSIREGDDDTTAKVIPYSLVHVFFEQYLTIWHDTIQNVGLSIFAIFIVTFLLLGLDFFSALVIVWTITMIIINLMGLMYWWNISLNAVSLVNLVVGVGISVEFVSHLTRCFTLSPEPTRIQRAAESLEKMGASILSGITLTDCGILVLALAKSQIFKIYYFRMYLGIIAFGTLHSLIFLPVFLSLFGPPLNKKRMFNHIRLQNQISRTDLTVTTPTTTL